MMDVSQRQGYQIIDPKLNLIYPWYTKPFLDILETWNLSQKIIFEFGIGYSTVWFANHCKYLYGVDNNLQWINETKEYLTKLNLRNKAQLFYAHASEENQQSIDAYLYKIEKMFEQPDIIVIDGIFRDECIPAAIKQIKNHGIIICDNWMQEEVWVCKTPELLTKFEHHIFKQEGHPHWQTAYFIINKH